MGVGRSRGAGGPGVSRTSGDVVCATHWAKRPKSKRHCIQAAVSLVCSCSRPWCLLAPSRGGVPPLGETQSAASQRQPSETRVYFTAAPSLRTRTPPGLGLSCPQPDPREHPARWVPALLIAPRPSGCEDNDALHSKCSKPAVVRLSTALQVLQIFPVRMAPATRLTAPCAPRRRTRSSSRGWLGSCLGALYSHPNTLVLRLTTFPEKVSVVSFLVRVRDLCFAYHAACVRE